MNFQLNRVQIFLQKNRMLHKLATTNSNFEKKLTISDMHHRISICISVFSKFGLVDESEPYTQIYLKKNGNLQF